MAGLSSWVEIWDSHATKQLVSYFVEVILNSRLSVRRMITDTAMHSYLHTFHVYVYVYYLLLLISFAILSISIYCYMD